jgi:hypothetical protein
MVKVAKPKTLKELPLMEVRALARFLDMNRSPEISLMLRMYQGDIPSTDLM